MFKKITPKDVVSRQLEEAELSRLSELCLLEAAQARVDTLEMRIERLKYEKSQYEKEEREAREASDNFMIKAGYTKGRWGFWIPPYRTPAGNPLPKSEQGETQDLSAFTEQRLKEVS